MPPDRNHDTERDDIDELVTELEKAEAYELRLRQFFVDARDQLAAGNVSVALSTLNEALRYIDAETDVVVRGHDET